MRKKIHDSIRLGRVYVMLVLHSEKHGRGQPDDSTVKSMISGGCFFMCFPDFFII